MTGRIQSLTARLCVATALNIVLLTSVADAYNSEAATAAAAGADCTLIAPFYWEIGGATGAPIVSGNPGLLWSRSSPFNIASSSKWVFGAYVMEKTGGVPTGDVLKGLEMQNGYRHFDETLCTLSHTVSGCFSVAHDPSPDNGYDAAADGNFFYSGGDDQYLASTASLLNLGGDTATQLTSEINSYLHLGSSMKYQFPAIAGGLQSNSVDFAAFLQKLMVPHASGGYVMADYLGATPVATQPCTISGCSPAGDVAFHYSVNHWVEDNTVGGTLEGGIVTVGPGDGSFSSPGAYGFYPWITADKRFYGIIARKGTPLGFEQSLKCGQEIRAAFLGN